MKINDRDMAFLEDEVGPFRAQFTGSNRVKTDAGGDRWYMLAGFDSRGFAVVICGTTGSRLKSTIRIRCGCRWFTLKQAGKHWRENIRTRGDAERRKAAREILTVIQSALDLLHAKHPYRVPKKRVVV